MRVFGCTAFAKKLEPGITKLSDRSIPRVFFGYESGTKGYRIFDPVNNRLMVSRDVIFDEQTARNWEEKNDELGGMTAAVPYTFEVQYDDTVHGPTINRFSWCRWCPSLSIAVNSIPRGVRITIYSHLWSRVISTGNLIQWVTPPTNGSADSEGVPLRYRTVADLLDSIELVPNVEYSGMCLVPAEEPSSVEEAMTE